MLPVAEDFRAEVAELHAFLGELDAEDWDRTTLFMEWTPWDVVAHLHFFDEVSFLSANDADAFAARRKVLTRAMAEGRSNKDQAREAYAGIAAPELVERWVATANELARVLGASDPKRRLPWFGPDMGVQMFTTARYMETWAHGQEIWDLRGRPRPASDRIQNIAVIGVKTYGWTFANRGLEPPGAPPYVRLEAPSGAIWEWNDPDDANRVEGSALDFCKVVTQVRNVQDTALRVQGEVATRWMEIAQCFAGGAVDPPPPGLRVDP